MQSTNQDTLPETARAMPSTRLRLFLAVIAGLCWAAMIVLITLGDLSPTTPWLDGERILASVLAAAAAIFTFAPLEHHLQLGGLTAEGTLGMLLLLVLLVFAPAPTGSLLELPDVPLYILFLLALLLSSAALVRPFVAVISRRVFHERARALDSGRIRRQAYVIGLFPTILIALAALRTLNWATALLIAVVLAIAELLFLSLFKAEA